MLNPLIRFSLRHRPLVVAACLVTLGYGGYLATTLPIDVFPDLDRPRVTVMTECHGLAAEEVETLVTFPLEAAVLGANGVQNVRTQSGPGLSIVVIEFGWGTDIRAARQTIQERLGTVSGDLPPDIRPQMTPIGSVLGQVVVAGLRRQLGPKGGDLTPVPGTTTYAERVRVADGTPTQYAWTPTDRKTPAAWTAIPTSDVAWQAPSAEGDQRAKATIGGRKEDVTFPSELKRQLALRTLADWVVRPRLLKVSGVANIIALGGGRKQYHVLVNPAALHEHKISLARVEEALRANNVNFTGGFADLGGVEKPIRVIGRLGPRPEQVVADLKLIVVKPPSKPEPGQPLGRAVGLALLYEANQGAEHYHRADHEGGLQIVGQERHAGEHGEQQVEGVLVAMP